MFLCYDIIRDVPRLRADSHAGEMEYENDVDGYN